jgi:2-phosphosulfolactate phosphatase
MEIPAVKKKIDVCLTPELIHQHGLQNKIVVVVDIFRATSCIVSGLSTGVSFIRPLSGIDETLEWGAKGYITAGERGGLKVDGFDMGNSPFEYMRPEMNGKKVAISTTNGSQAILKSLAADEILIGAFLNISATAHYITSKHKDVVVHCAGWKGAVNLEDTLYAGALIEKLTDGYQASGDSAILAHQLYLANQHDLLAISQRSSHAERLAGFGVIKDIAYCVQMDEFDSVIKLVGEELVKI